MYTNISDQCLSNVPFKHVFPERDEIEDIFHVTYSHVIRLTLYSVGVILEYFFNILEK